MTNNQQPTTNKGFTIIETLVAVAILVAVVVGTMGAVQTAISSYIYSKDQIIAFYLAQEGFEQIRNLRDENRLAGRNWLYGIAQYSSDACYFGKVCIVSPVDALWPVQCSGGTGACPYLRQEPAAGFYGYTSTWNDTQFRREITLTSINAEEISVNITVSWKKGLVSRQFRTRENLL